MSYHLKGIFYSLHFFYFFLQNGMGYAKQITFEDITLEQTRNPIIIDQEYRDLTVFT